VTRTFDPAKYTVADIFADDITIGGTGFYNGRSLTDYLKQTNYYNTYNTSLRQLFILNKPLTPGEVVALSLINRDVNDLTLSVPCGQRSNIEEITRLFKFGVPESYSNHIKVQIKNSGITDPEFKEAIEQRVRDSLAKISKGDVQIDDISFIDYTPSA